MALALPWALVLVAKTPTQRLSSMVLTVLGVLGYYIALNDSVLSDRYGSLKPTYGMIAFADSVVLEMASVHCWPLPLSLLALFAVLRSASA